MEVQVEAASGVLLVEVEVEVEGVRWAPAVTVSLTGHCWLLARVVAVYQPALAPAQRCARAERRGAARARSHRCTSVAAG